MVAVGRHGVLTPNLFRQFRFKVGKKDKGGIHQSERFVTGNHAIVIVDDDPDYSYLLEAAFHELAVQNPIAIIADGWAALSYLEQTRTGDGEPIDLPALVLLDLKMPRLGGFEVLRWIRRQEQLLHVPVVMFSGSEEDQEGSRAIASGATAFFVKPFSYHDLLQQATTLRDAYLFPGALKHAA